MEASGLSGADRRLCRRVRHSCLWRLRLLHEREYDADRLSERTGEIRGSAAFGGGNRILRGRGLGRDVAHAFRVTSFVPAQPKQYEI